MIQRPNLSFCFRPSLTAPMKSSQPVSINQPHRLPPQIGSTDTHNVDATNAVLQINRRTAKGRSREVTT